MKKKLQCPTTFVLYNLSVKKINSDKFVCFFKDFCYLGDRVVLYNTDEDEVELEHDADEIIADIEDLLLKLRQLLFK